FPDNDMLVNISTLQMHANQLALTFELGCVFKFELQLEKSFSFIGFQVQPVHFAASKEVYEVLSDTDITIYLDHIEDIVLLLHIFFAEIELGRVEIILINHTIIA
ncbi:hypothetical protein ACJX0J_031009, partial [Zea mays]